MSCFAGCYLHVLLAQLSTREAPEDRHNSAPAAAAAAAVFMCSLSASVLL
jgi:hypothetical protein